MTDTIYVYVQNFMQECDKANLAFRISFGGQRLNNILNFLFQRSKRKEKIKLKQKLILPGTQGAGLTLVPVRKGQARQWRQELTHPSANSQSFISSACHTVSKFCFLMSSLWD